MRNYLLILNLMLLIFFTASCSIFIAGRPAFINPSFDYSAIKKRGITVLPVSGGTADRSIREEAGLAFDKELKKRYPDVKLNSSQDSGNKLIESDLMETYIEVISAYEMTGSLQTSKLTSIAELFGWNYLIILNISRYDKEKINDDYKYIVELELQAWDVETKQSVFVNTTTGEDEPSGWLFDSVNPHDAAKEAGERAVKYLPKIK